MDQRMKTTIKTLSSSSLEGLILKCLVIILIAAINKCSVSCNAIPTTLNVTRLDCQMRLLLYNRTKKIIINGGLSDDDKKYAKIGRSIDDNHCDKIDTLMRNVYDALQLKDLCHFDYDGVDHEKAAITDNDEMFGEDFRKNDTSTTLRRRRRLLKHVHHKVSTDICETPNENHNTLCCIYVNATLLPSGEDIENQQQDGSVQYPYRSIHQAIHHARTLRRQQQQSQESNNNNTSVSYNIINIILRRGVHYLQGTAIELSSSLDSNLTIRGYPGEDVWISGGLKLADYNVEFHSTSTNGIYLANLSTIFEKYPQKMPSLISLFTSKRRYIRARYPNGDPEIIQWGYASPTQHDVSLSTGDNVREWLKPPPGLQPEFVYVDFENHPPPGIPIKNDSTMTGYNLYASGKGGVCSDVWDNNNEFDVVNSYWCSNASQGGWAEVDRECAMTGQLQLPMGMKYNTSAKAMHTIHNVNSTSLNGGIIFAWHSQSWSMHMFEIMNHYHDNSTIVFAKGGGKQGGRNWCRCDQCTYAGRWCGQHETPPQKNDQRLIGGNWYIENVKDFLDRPSEYYFDRATNILYVKPNTTDDLQDFTLGIMTELIDLRNTKYVTIENIGFRDQAPTFLEDGWSAPSGGDWALRRGGAIYLKNSSNIAIRHCDFYRLDGTAIFLSDRTRNVTIEYNTFEWLGENAIATWGKTDDYDGTANDFPMYTLIQFNVVRELGIYQKQSSAVGQCKAAMTTIRHNIMFNMPRAAINFNDMVGGGDIVEANIIFNTCRESGDHGPINSWDRQPYLTTLRDGKTKSFIPLVRTIRYNFIIANYGASQGVDNDDGSSWYHIHHNVFYIADGFKMDYGGHDSVFENNLIIAYPYAGNCFGMGSFLEGHGDIFRNNQCLIGLGRVNKRQDEHSPSFVMSKSWKIASDIGDDRNDDDDDNDNHPVGGLWDECIKGAPVTLASNNYYTPDGQVYIGCGGNGDLYSLYQLQSQYGMELHSTANVLPSNETIILEWAKLILVDRI